MVMVDQLNEDGFDVDNHGCLDQKDHSRTKPCKPHSSTKLNHNWYDGGPAMVQSQQSSSKAKSQEQIRHQRSSPHQVSPLDPHI